MNRTELFFNKIYFILENDIKMAEELNRDLKSYLNKSSSTETLLSLPSSTTNGVSSIFSQWFRRNSQEVDGAVNGNGWFSQAEQDPLFPSLVSCCNYRKRNLVGLYIMGSLGWHWQITCPHPLKIP